MAVTVAVVLIGLSVWYRVAVVPELTAVEYELWVVGTDNDLVIEVDIESDLVLVANVPSGLPDMVVDDQAVYVRADTPGAGLEAVEWVAVPLGVLDERYAVLAADRLRPAISRDVKECTALSTDARSIVDLLLGPSPTRPADASLCERAAGAAADAGEDIFVSWEWQRPSGTARTAVDDAISYIETPNPAALLELLGPRKS